MTSVPTINGDLSKNLEPLIAVLTDDTAQAANIRERLLAATARFVAQGGAPASASMTERTAYLITYGDSIRRPDQAPLATLRHTLDATVGPLISDVHLLPIFPWTSDDGFAVTDYHQVDPALGDWDDVTALAQNRGIALDFVANHMSSEAGWFRGWLERDPEYADFFVTPADDFDTSQVVRPRTSPLTHRYERPDGSIVRAWSTFGRDQVDVNAANPATLEALTDVLLAYVAQGATTIRLDAIGYLWKESGTSCIHLPGTHAIVKIWRAILDHVAPGVKLLTETNVPHPDNISYFGDLTDEAHMVYQFALPPLVLHSFLSGSASRLSEWSRHLEDLGEHATWFNFLASHDGVGMRPSRGILTAEEQEALADRAHSSGGRASYAAEPDGSQSVYELNVNYLDALVDDNERQDDAVVASRARAAHAILLAQIGVPAIYVHSLFGSRADIAGMVESGVNRRINREKLDADALVSGLEHDARRRGVFEALSHMLTVRRRHAAFAPTSPQEVLDWGSQVYAIRRGSGAEAVTVVVNVSRTPARIEGRDRIDVLTGDSVGSIDLQPDGVVWLKEG
ncbi:alpha-amylase family glycosyl hydrolase [Demequina sediminicola]|uniref:alpha-amylase family glycosyl hydrolase n=1 Tax=Demequina sediminicola TaxID=1095026 RepID=UPI00078329ED|nr:alpha-amylase family glycosyl hydrolase [Demequina sediminicola]